MGNTGTSLRETLLTDQPEVLRELLSGPDGCDILEKHVNKRGDTPLPFCLRHKRYNLVPVLLDAGCQVNVPNKDGETPLDVALKAHLPDDDDILHDHFCPYSAACGADFTVPDAVIVLQKSGALGHGLHRLIMHVMKDASSIGKLCQCIQDLTHPRNFRICALLLQVAVWFDQTENLHTLVVERGVDVQEYWNSPFLPQITPSQSSRCDLPWPQAEAMDYTLCENTVSESLQHLKLNFVKDWMAEWRDGENPEAQYRAGLQITPDAAVVLVKNTNTYNTLIAIMWELSGYLPRQCGGPDLRLSPLIPCLALAGYQFSEPELKHLSLKFDVDFTAYRQSTESPVPLKHLSRLCVRFSCRRNVGHSVASMCFLPETIRRYILLDDVMPMDQTVFW